MRTASFMLSFCLVFPAGTGIALAQEVPAGNTEKVVRVVRVESPPVIDGKLDDAIWQQADVISDFHQTRPGNGAEPSDRTEVYLVYDDNAIYIGARMFDSEPDRIAAPTMRHGQGLGSDDRMVVILDPFNTGRGAYRFETNVNGVRHDAIYNSVDSFDSAWTVIWDSAASVFDNGWTAELEIPFKTLSFDPANETWGFNFGRGIRRRGEEIAWVSRNRTYNASILGLATGLRDMDQGIGLDIVPSVSVSEKRTYTPGDKDLNFEPSLDVYYRVTPSLNASLTFNTDFSATEVDDRQVNLTRFSLFFPEKRDFFLNDSDLFQFGGISFVDNQASTGSNDQNGRPFFSRRLGLSRTGIPVDLKYGGKLSGRVGRWNIGMLVMHQDAFGTVDASNVMVGRVSANVLDESSVGMIFTSGDPGSNLENTAGGVDFRYLNTHLPGGRTLEADAWYQQSDTESLDGDDAAYGISIVSPNNSGLRGGARYKEIQANFNPALGFVTRTNVSDAVADIGYTHYTRGDFLQTVYSGIDVERVSGLDGGGLESQVMLGRLAEFKTTTGDTLNVRYKASKEVITEPFIIYEDNLREVIMPPGTYSFGEKIVSISTAGQRDLSGGLTFNTGDFYTGTRRSIDANVRWRQSRYLQLSMGYEINKIKLPQGNFNTHVASFTTEVNFSSTIYMVNLVQYDTVSEVIGVNARLVWIPTAGQEALIVLNHSMQDEDKDNSFISERNDITAKLSYTFRF